MLARQPSVPSVTEEESNHGSVPGAVELRSGREPGDKRESAVRHWVAGPGDRGRARSRFGPTAAEASPWRVAKGGHPRSTQSSRARRQWESLVAAVPNASAAETRPSPAGRQALSLSKWQRVKGFTTATGSGSCGVLQHPRTCAHAKTRARMHSRPKDVRAMSPGLLETKRRMPRPKTIISPMLVPADALMSYLTDFNTSMQIVV